MDALHFQLGARYMQNWSWARMPSIPPNQQRRNVGQTQSPLDILGTHALAQACSLQLGKPPALIRVRACIWRGASFSQDAASTRVACDGGGEEVEGDRAPTRRPAEVER